MRIIAADIDVHNVTGQAVKADLTTPSASTRQSLSLEGLTLQNEGYCEEQQ